MAVHVNAAERPRLLAHRALDLRRHARSRRYGPDTGTSRVCYASIAFAEPPRFAERVTYETASSPSNATGARE